MPRSLILRCALVAVAQHGSRGNLARAMGREAAYTTVLKLMQNMTEKRLVRRDARHVRALTRRPPRRSTPKAAGDRLLEECSTARRPSSSCRRWLRRRRHRRSWRKSGNSWTNTEEVADRPLDAGNRLDVDPFRLAGRAARARSRRGMPCAGGARRTHCTPSPAPALWPCSPRPSSPPRSSGHLIQCSCPGGTFPRGPRSEPSRPCREARPMKCHRP